MLAWGFGWHGGDNVKRIDRCGMAKAKLQSYDLTQLNILVLEKHVLIRQLLTDVFRIFGVATVQSTSDPDKAFKIFQAFPSDVVLTD